MNEQITELEKNQDFFDKEKKTILFADFERFLDGHEEKEKETIFGQTKVWLCDNTVEISIKEKDGRIWRFSVFKTAKNPDLGFFSWCEDKDAEKRGIKYSPKEVLTDLPRN